MKKAKAVSVRGSAPVSKTGEVGSTPAPPAKPSKAAKKKRSTRSKKAFPKVTPLSPVPPPIVTGFVAPLEFKPPRDFSFWTKEDHNELAEAWLLMNERQQRFFTEWYTNGFNATSAYSKIYEQENRHVARVCASQLLASPNILRLRRAIWMIQTPPIELMAATEQAALEADENTDPKAYRTHLMKLTAVESIRKFHKLLPAQDMNLNVKGKVDHEHKGKVKMEIDTEELKGMLNGSGS